MTKPIPAFCGEYRFLSNFYPCHMVYKGLTYPTSEHTYQAQKCADKTDRFKIAQAENPSRAKQISRLLKKRSDWDDIKLDVMRDILQLKFAPETKLAQQLIATKDALLIENNTWCDTFWGVYEGKGENNLGKLLMKIRKTLIKNPKPKSTLESDDPVITGKTKRVFHIKKRIVHELILLTTAPTYSSYEKIGEFESVERARTAAKSLAPKRKIKVDDE